MNNPHITAESLKSGLVLRALIHRYHETPTEQALVSVLGCLRDSVVWTPIRGTEHTARGILPRPDLLRAEDGSYHLPVFSAPEELPEEYRDSFSLQSMPFLQCIQLQQGREDLGELIINPFTEALPLHRQILAIIPQLPSRLENAADCSQ
ncbi:MAG: SseB family protein [Oscillospiraceae bacterium]|nr:SseB family protein [Oscillospiraceae bacterium]